MYRVAIRLSLREEDFLRVDRLIAVQSIHGVIQPFREGRAAEYRIAGSCDQT
jgi:hypothetical protein